MSDSKKVLLIVSAILLMMVIGIYLQNMPVISLSPAGEQCAGFCPVLGSEALKAEGDGEASYVVSESQAKTIIYSSITCRNAKSEAAEKCKDALQKMIDETKKKCDAKKTQCEGAKSEACSCVFPIYAPPAAYCQLPESCTTTISKYKGEIGSSTDPDGTKTPDARKEKAEGDVKITSTAQTGGEVVFTCPCEGRAKTTNTIVPIPETEEPNNMAEEPYEPVPEFDNQYEAWTAK